MKETKKKDSLICEDWLLYDKAYSGFVSTDAATGLDFVDVKEESKSIRVFGTEKQIREAAKNYNIDEVYSYKVEKKGSYWYDIFDDPVAHNKTVRQSLKEYKKLYELNNNEILIL